MRTRHFPDFIDAYLEYTSGHEGTPRCHLWSIISVIAASLERKVWLDRGFYTLFPNLYVFIIGKSGLVKKSTTTKIAVDLFRELPRTHMMAERVTAASLLDNFKLAGRTFKWGQVDRQQSAVFTYASELSVFMSEVAGSITELLTTFYDCQPDDCTKPWSYETVSKGKTLIFGPCLNILGASTPAWLKKCVPANEMEGGFSSRVVFVVENRGPQTFVAWPESRAGETGVKRKLVEDLECIHDLVGKVTVDPKAREMFSKWYEYHMRHTVPQNYDPRMTGYYARKGDLMLKLAMIKSVSRSNDLVMSPEDLLWAGQEIENLEPDMKTCFEGVTSTPATEHTYDVRQFIRQHGPVEKAEIMRAFAHKATSWDIDRCIADLVEMQEIDMEETCPPGENPKQTFSPRGSVRPSGF